MTLIEKEKQELSDQELIRVFERVGAFVLFRLAERLAPKIGAGAQAIKNAIVQVYDDMKSEGAKG